MTPHISDNKKTASEKGGLRRSTSATMASAGGMGLPGLAAQGAAREVEQRFMRSFPAHLRHAVIRGLVTGGEYAFRVAAINSAGRGKPGPWTGIVRVIDPADEMD